MPVLFWLLPIGTMLLVHNLTRPVVGTIRAWLLGIGTYLGPGLFLALMGALATPDWVAYRGLAATVGSIAVETLVWPWWLKLLASH